MLRIYQLHNKRNITLLFLGLLAFASYAQVEKKDTLLIQYKIGFNGILDKSIVTRLLLTTQNSFVFRNRWTSFEPILNYRFGHVQPNGRAKTDLENDYYILLKNHFAPQRRIFPSLLGGFENSPNIRRLDTRYLGGAGIGSYLVKAKNNQLQTMLYAVYEKSTFDMLQYAVMRIMPFIKGNHFSEKSKLGIAYIINPYLTPWENNNWRFRGNVRPYFKMTPKLDFSISYDLWYESLVSGIQPQEISVITLGFNYANF